MLAELDREAMKRAGVQTLQKPFTMNCARRSSREIWRMTSGFRYCSTAGIVKRWADGAADGKSHASVYSTRV